MITWFWDFLPSTLISFAIIGILLIGITGIIASIFLQHIPFFSKYKLPVQVISISLILLGAYSQGSYSTEMSWRLKTAELEAKVLVAQAKSTEVTAQLDRELETRVEEIEKLRSENRQNLEKIRKTVDQFCQFPDEAIESLNRAARGRK